MSQLHWEGYVELYNGEGVSRIEIYKDGEYVNVFVGGNLADDVGEWDDLTSQYGPNFYQTLDDYKRGIVLDIEDVWPYEIENDEE